MQLNYSGSKEFHDAYTEATRDGRELSDLDLMTEIRGKVEELRGVCREVLENGCLDLHEYNALYQLYKEAAFWYLMDAPAMIRDDIVLPLETAEHFVDHVVPECIRNVYFATLAAVIKGVEKIDIARLGDKTTSNLEIFLEAYEDARIDMIRWRVVEKLEEYGYMN